MRSNLGILRALSSRSRNARWDEFYMAPSATTINENGKHWQWAMFFEGIVFEGEGRSPITDGVKLPVISALYGAITMDKGDRPMEEDRRPAGAWQSCEPK